MFTKAGDTRKTEPDKKNRRRLGNPGACTTGRQVDPHGRVSPHEAARAATVRAI